MTMVSVSCPRCNAEQNVSLDAGFTCWRCRAEYDRALSSPAQQTQTASRWLIPVLLFVGSITGTVLNEQNVSLLTGMSIVWVGMVIAIGVAALSFVLPVPTWVKVVLSVIALVSVGNAFYVQHELANRQHELNQILNNLRG